MREYLNNRPLLSLLSVMLPSGWFAATALDKAWSAIQSERYMRRGRIVQLSEQPELYFAYVAVYGIGGILLSLIVTLGLLVFVEKGWQQTAILRQRTKSAIDRTNRSNK